MARPSHYGTPGSTVPEATRKQIIAWCEQGVTRNEIAKRTGYSGSTVSGVVKTAGLSFDRSRIKAATEARTADLRARRTALSAKLLQKADELLDEMDKPFLAFNIGGKDNVYTEHPLEHAPTVDKKNLMQAASTALQRHIDLELHDADQAADDAKSMLAALGRALGVQPVDAG